MSEQRFRILETRALYELGLPTIVLWGALALQVLAGALHHGGWRIPFAGFGLNLLVYNFLLAAGFSLVWLLAWQWTQTEVVVGVEGLSFVVMGQLRWSVPWPALAAWTWDWHWALVPQGLRLVAKDGRVYRVRLGFLGLGRSVGGVVQVYPYYVPLLKALGYYLPGEVWHEPAPPGKATKGGWG